jgi:hypothetical protein
LTAWTYTKWKVIKWQKIGGNPFLSVNVVFSFDQTP